jgi:PAS domain-containing protein
VSIFKVNVLRGQFNLLAQRLGPQGGTPFPNDYTQPLGEGLLGLCYDRKDCVNLSDRNDGSVEARRFKEVSKTTVSELCIPIELRGRLLWIFNLEDSRRNAFNKPEIATLKDIVCKISTSIDHLFEGHILSQVLQVFPEAVLITNSDGDVLLGNDNAEALLGLDGMPKGLNLRRFLTEADFKTAHQ